VDPGRIKRALHRLAVAERPDRIVHHDQLCLWRRETHGAAHRILPRGSAAHAPDRHCPFLFFQDRTCARNLSRRQGNYDLDDAVQGQKAFNGAQQDWFACQIQELLRNRSFHAAAGTARGDDSNNDMPGDLPVCRLRIASCEFSVWQLSSSPGVSGAPSR
jgi:hypothetical protein